MPRLFDVLELLEGMIIYYIPPEETRLFRPKEGQIAVGAMKIRMNLCFAGANNLVPVEDILKMYNVDDTLSEAARYTSRI